MILIGSLVVNLGLGVGWLCTARRDTRFNALGVGRTVVTNTQVRTSVVVRKQFISWAEVESSNYPTYIENLRVVGCPESTIRDIIVADVNQLYAIKRATEVVTAEQQWWRSEPSPEVVKAAEDRLEALDAERRILLTTLLGPQWELDDVQNFDLAGAVRIGPVLDGPVLGLLSEDARMAVRAIALTEQDKMAALIMKEGGKVDSVELARIQQEARTRLAEVLTPPQLEEYLLRYSPGAQNLRRELGLLQTFNASPTEFRNLFHAVDAIDQQLALTRWTEDPISQKQRDSLVEQRENAIRTALGQARYNQFLSLHDEDYRDASLVANDSGTPRATKAIVDINRATDLEKAIIEIDPTLTDLQRKIALKKTELEQLMAQAAVTGQGNFPEPPKPPVNRITHVALPMDTLNRLAEYYKVPVQQIVAANPGVNLINLRPGTPVTIPVPLNR